MKDSRINKFETIKSHFEFSSDVDTVRACIDKTFESLSHDPLVIRPELQEILELLTSNQYLKSKHLVFSINDIVNEAIHQWIQSRRSELNLFSISFRSELPSDENAVAMVFVEQQINFPNGLSVTDIKSFLNDFEDALILRILRKFQSNQLIHSNKIKNTELFFALYP